MRKPAFDIFSGTPDTNACWLETVEGLSDARARMEVVAAQAPGQYFVFCTETQTVMAQTETFSKAKVKSNGASGLFRTHCMAQKASPIV